MRARIKSKNIGYFKEIKNFFLVLFVQSLVLWLVLCFMVRNNICLKWTTFVWCPFR